MVIVSVGMFLTLENIMMIAVGMLIRALGSMTAYVVASTIVVIIFIFVVGMFGIMVSMLIGGNAHTCGGLDVWRSR